MESIMKAALLDEYAPKIKWSKRRSSVLITASFFCSMFVPTPIDAADQQQAPVASYVPSISDFMIATIQPRHIRLWLAAESKNWDFAGYELGNLKGAFGRLGQAHPTSNDVPFKEMITSATEQPIADLEKAIKSKDPAAFGKAYAGLSASCNACHEGMNKAMVVISVPTKASVFDMEFMPAQR
jgi:hypothetical protein